MSVGDTLGVTPSRDKTVNLDEDRVLQVGRAAATSQDEHRMGDKRYVPRGDGSPSSELDDEDNDDDNFEVKTGGPKSGDTLIATTMSQ